MTRIECGLLLHSPWRSLHTVRLHGSVSEQIGVCDTANVVAHGEDDDCQLEPRDFDRLWVAANLSSELIPGEIERLKQDAQLSGVERPL